MQPFDVLTPGLTEADVAVPDHSQIVRIAQRLDSAVLRGKALSDRERVIFRAIVRDDELEILKALGQDGFDRLRKKRS